MASGRKCAESCDRILPAGCGRNPDNSIDCIESDHSRAYDSRLNAFADFSGRGGENLPYPKPDLVAPGVDILAPSAGGGYTGVTGTSFATPFVTGAAAPYDGMGHYTQKRSFSLGRKSEGISPPRCPAPARV